MGIKMLGKLSSGTQETMKGDNGVISLIPSISSDDFRAAIEGVSLSTAILVISAVIGLTIVHRAIKFAMSSKQGASSMVLESLNSNVINTPLRQKAGRPYELDTEKLLAKNSFPIKPAALVTRCKEVLDKAFTKGFHGLAAEDMAEDFVAVFHVGPSSGQLVFNKEEYLEAVNLMRVRDAFPDFSPNLCNFVVDSVLTNRIWMHAYPRGVHSGKETPLFGKATNVSVCLPPSALSLTFNTNGAVVCFSASVLDITQGTTDGLAFGYGLLWAIGRPLPYPEARPYKESLRLSIYRRIRELNLSLSKLLGKGEQSDPAFFPSSST